MFSNYILGQVQPSLKVHYSYSLNTEHFNENKQKSGFEKLDSFSKEIILESIQIYDYIGANIPYILLSNQNESIGFFENNIMLPEDLSSLQKTLIQSTTKNSHYNHLKDSLNYTTIEVNKKKYNVKNHLPIWEITSETKTIQNFTCYKATTANGSVTAWFAPEIPTPFGPEKYFGLPGLILQINRGSIQIDAKEIQFNPNQTYIIQKTEATEITEEELQKIINQAKMNMH